MSIRPLEIAIWPVLPTPKKSQIPIWYRGTVKMYTLYGNPYQLRYSVSPRSPDAPSAARFSTECYVPTVLRSQISRRLSGCTKLHYIPTV